MIENQMILFVGGFGQVRMLISLASLKREFNKIKTSNIKRKKERKEKEKEKKTSK